MIENEEKQIEDIRKVIANCDDVPDDVCRFKPCSLCKAERLYNAGYRKQSEWISVSERLPEDCTHVIVCDEDGTVGEAFCYKEGRFEWMDSDELAFVTHWMPLPEPPKGV